MTVTVESGGAELDTGATLDGPGVTTGVETGLETGLDGPGPGTTGEVVAPAVQRVQIVEVEVKVTVDIVWVVCKLVVPPVVMVFVTGHEVTVVWVTTVTVESEGTEELPTGTEDDTDPVTGDVPEGTRPGELAGTLIEGTTEEETEEE